MSKGFIAAFAACGLILIAGFLAGCASSATDANAVEFRQVNDTPIVNNLDDYYTLISTGKLETDEGTIWLQDLSYDERRELQLRLRTP